MLLLRRLRIDFSSFSFFGRQRRKKKTSRKNETKFKPELYEIPCFAFFSQKRERKDPSGEKSERKKTVMRHAINENPLFDVYDSPQQS